MKSRFLTSKLILEFSSLLIGLFIILTQFQMMRQPAKFLLQVICIFTFLTFLFDMVTYLKEDKD